MVHSSYSHLNRREGEYELGPVKSFTPSYPASGFGTPSHLLWLLCFLGLDPLAFAALYFAHRSFVAFEIFALAAADMTHFFLPFGSPLLAATPRPRIFIAARTVSTCCCTMSACFCNFASSCSKAAKMSMNPPTCILSRPRPRVKLVPRRIGLTTITPVTALQRSRCFGICGKRNNRTKTRRSVLVLDCITMSAPRPELDCGCSTTAGSGERSRT